MGEVYRARDGKLRRDVAIKVLPDEVAQDAERWGRFQREAQVLASLNHPNIGSIYGLEESGGTHGLILELIEGQTLAERISGRPIPVDEAREIARQITEALEEAHGHGIVHRDLKPANVKLTPDGKVKVLDFGLAKTFAEDTAKADLAIALVASLTAALLSSSGPADRSDSGGDNPLAGARFSKIADFEGAEAQAAISPDGRFVTFTSDRDGQPDAFLGQIDTGQLRNLTQGREELSKDVGFTGDGSEVWLAGGSELRMRTVPLLGGSARNYMEEGVVRADWSPDGERVVLQGNPDGDPIYVADRSGTNSRTILQLGKGMHQHYPTWSVDVRTKVSRRASVGLEQYTSVSASTDRRRLVATVQNPRAGLWSVPILDGVATEADAEPLADLSSARVLAPRFAGSVLFYLSSRGTGDGLWSLRDGQSTEIWKGSEAALLNPVAVSADGQKVALSLRRGEAWRLHVLSEDGAELRVLSETVDARGAATWSPDGRWIVTGGNEAGVDGLFKIPVDGGATERIADGQALDPVWSQDGSLIVFAGVQVKSSAPLEAIRPNGDPVDLPEIRVRRDGERMRFLPDGSGLV